MNKIQIKKRAKSKQAHRTAQNDHEQTVELERKKCPKNTHKLT